MKLKVMKTAICRTPAFALDDVLQDVWEELKTKIRESSPSFYQVIKNIGRSEIDTLTPKMLFTVWKYFTRAKFRATPFGSFSALNLVPVIENNQPVEISRQITEKEFIDWSEKDSLTADLDLVLRRSHFFYQNSSNYLVMDEIRYIRSKDGKFELATVKLFPELEAIMTICKTPCTLDEICSKMNAAFGLNKRHTRRIIGQLIEIQLIITDLFPNITGEDYFRRTDNEKPGSAARYVISSRTLNDGGLAAEKLRNLPKLIQFLATHLPDYPAEDLEDFKRAFRLKFDNSEVPLSKVMDPEIGISYGKLEQHPGNETLKTLRSLNLSSKETIPLRYTKLHSFILDQLYLRQPIRLEKFEGEPHSNRFPANSGSVILHFHHQSPVIEGIYPTTATALAGRFTLSDPSLHQYAREIADIEMKSNPDVIFFDIAYQAEQKVDNVNRRRAIYTHELPILTWSCASDQLDFNDILITVIDNEVVLRSKKYGKRLIPRIPSAYNYTRSDLAAYRFLCDVQNQHVKTGLNFDLRNYFPDLSYYPRVMFMDTIISPAMWKVPLRAFNKEDKIIDGRKELNEWLTQQGITSWFKVGDTDQTLCFNPAAASDLDAFLMYCKQQSCGQLYLSEALIGDDGEVLDEKGKHYLAQFIVSYYHEQQLYKGLATPGFKKDTQGIPALFLPGSAWLYYELYCYPTRSNALLVYQIGSFLRQFKSSFHKWFFIRYDRHGPHLRLRLHLKDPATASLINHRLTALLGPFIQSGQLIDLCIKPYHREILRYGEHKIEKVEYFFFLDSEYALSLLRQMHSIEKLYILTLIFIKEVFLSNFDTPAERISFAKHMADRFACEHGLLPAAFKELNQTFTGLKDHLHSHSGKPLHAKYQNVMAGLLKGCDVAEKEKLMADLIHMHINRLFASDQRLHETILYHYLVRMLMADRARSGLPKAPQD